MNIKALVITIGIAMMMVVLGRVAVVFPKYAVFTILGFAFFLICRTIYICLVRLLENK
jgi:hypothetical protein